VAHYQCQTCGESVDSKGSPHDCPGSARGLREHVDELYMLVEALEARIVRLERIIARSQLTVKR